MQLPADNENKNNERTKNILKTKHRYETENSSSGR